MKNKKKKITKALALTAQFLKHKNFICGNNIIMLNRRTLQPSHKYACTDINLV